MRMSFGWLGDTDVDSLCDIRRGVARLRTARALRDPESSRCLIGAKFLRPDCRAAAVGGVSPRALFDRFNIEVLATTDAATDSLEQHVRIPARAWGGRAIPTSQGDRLLQWTRVDWRQDLDLLAERPQERIEEFDAFVAAPIARRAQEIDACLAIQEREAQWWRGASLLYVQTFSRRPLLPGYEAPAHSLDFYLSLDSPKVVTRPRGDWL